MNYKILKLKSGEELISEVTETKTTIVLINPMVFKTTTMVNNYGKPYDLTILKDWLCFNESKTIELKKNNFISISEPNSRSIKLYLLEKTRYATSYDEDILPISDDMPEVPSKNLPSLDKIFDDIVNELKSFPPEKFNNFPLPPMMRELEDTMANYPEMPSGPPEMEGDFMEKRMIYMTMVFPPEMIMNMITAGILNPKDLGKIIKQVKKDNKFTGDQTKRKDFGNKWTDWNPDIHGDEYK